MVQPLVQMCGRACGRVPAYGASLMGVCALCWGSAVHQPAAACRLPCPSGATTANLSAFPLPLPLHPQARKEQSEEASSLITREHAAFLTGATLRLREAKTALQTASDHVTALTVANQEARAQLRALHEARIQPGFAARPAEEQRQLERQLRRSTERVAQLGQQLESAQLACEQAQREKDHARLHKLACLGIHPPEPPPPPPRRWRAREGADPAGFMPDLWRQRLEEQALRAAVGLPPPAWMAEEPQWGWRAARPAAAAQQPGEARQGGAAAAAAAAEPDAGAAGPAQAAQPGPVAAVGGRRARQQDALAQGRRVRFRVDQDPAAQQAEQGEVQVVEER